jgi:predicted transglutaminase-like cysteine proteinase
MATRFRNLLTTAALGLSGVVMASPAVAATVDDRAGAIRWAKSEAIIGQPTALEAILAAQSGRSVERHTPRPMSLSRPAAGDQLRLERQDDEGATSGRPDVFGSVALRVSRTPLDRKWIAVERSPVGSGAARFAEAQRGNDALERLEAVNWYVNRRVRFVDDRVQFGRADVWTSAADTLSRRKGDCEDFAIAKLQMLRKAGFSDRDLYLVIVRDLVRRTDHAVLVARAEGRMYVLDNGTDELLDTASVADYRPIMTFAAGGTWTHGYRKSAGDVEYAEKRVQAVAPALGN